MKEHVGDSGLGRDPGPDIFISGDLLAELEKLDVGLDDRPVEGLMGGQLVFSRFRPAILVEELFFYPLGEENSPLSLSHWQQVQDLFSSHFPESRILGWFVIRPETGMMLEGTDKLRGASFFGDHWQIGLLMDGGSKSWKVFSWQNGTLRPSTRLRVLQAETMAQLKRSSEFSRQPPEKNRPKGKLSAGGKRRSFGVIIAAVIGLVALVGIILSQTRTPSFTEHTPTRQVQSRSVSGSGLRQTVASEQTAENQPSVSALEAGVGAQSFERIRQGGRLDTPAAQVTVTPVEANTAGPKALTPSFHSYTVKKGDSLWNISRDLLGDPSRYREIWEANPAITDPDRLTEGTELKIPFAP